MATVDEIVDRAIEYGNLSALRTELSVEGAWVALTGAQLPRENTSLPSLVAPPDVMPPDITQLQNLTADFDSISADVVRQIGEAYAQFLGDFVSLDAALSIGANVEEQLWQRDRDRLHRQAQASTDEALSQWANRGWPMPAGQALAATQRIQSERDSQIALSSRERAIKSWELEHDAAKFLLQVMSELRINAARAAAEYVKAIALGPQIAADTVKAKIAGATALNDALSNYYRAASQVYETKTSADVNRARITIEDRKVFMDQLMGAIQERVRVGLTSAQVFGAQAQAALNGVNATVQKITGE